MLRSAQEMRSSRPARNPVAATAGCHVLRTSLLTLATLFALALPASANADLFDELFLQSLGDLDALECKSSSVSFGCSGSRGVDAPTSKPARSILDYSKPIGDSGFIFRVRARPSPRRIVRFEIRF